MATPELRPLSVGEILDAAIKIYVRNAGTLFKIVLLVVAPAQALIGLVDLSLTEGTFSGVGDEQATREDIPAYIGGFATILVVSILSTLLATASCFKAVVDAYLGGRPTTGESLRFVASRLHSLLWVFVLIFVLGLLAMLAFVLPGIWLFVSWVVAVPALLAEDARGMDALRRSFRLVRGRWWPTFGIVVLGTLLASIVSGVVGGVVGVLGFAVQSDAAVFLVDFLGGTLGALITTPFTAAFITVLYVDLRVRKEAFDLQLLADRIGREPALSEGGIGLAPHAAPEQQPDA